MNAKMFSDAMGELNQKYIAEAMTNYPSRHPVFYRRRLHKLAVCFAVIALTAVLSLGTVFAASIEFRKAVIGLLTGGNIEQGISEDGFIYTMFNDTGDTVPVEVSDGQIYFVLNGTKTNITEFCSDTTAYVYETTDTDGTQHFLLIGGTPDNVGWAEFIPRSDKNEYTVIWDSQEDKPVWLSSWMEEYQNQNTNEMIFDDSDGDAQGLADLNGTEKTPSTYIYSNK